MLSSAVSVGPSLWRRVAVVLLLLGVCLAPAGPNARRELLLEAVSSTPLFGEGLATDSAVVPPLPR